TTIYKDEIKLLHEFKQYIFRKDKKKKQVPIAKEIETDVNACLEKIKKYQPVSPEYQPQSPSAQFKT
ncbi:5607_t:CDS:1, partial [Racocetra fulgida]